MFKKFIISIYAFSLFICLFSCSYDEENVDKTPTKLKHGYLLGYVPQGKVDTLTLANGQVVFMDEDSVYFLGDIIFSKEQIEMMNTPSTRSAGLKDYVKLWGNTIPFDIVNSKGAYSYDNEDLTTIYDAMTVMSNNSLLSFVPWNGTDAHYIRFFPDQGIHSPVGKGSGINNIVLQPDCFSRTDVMHEIMHSLGFFHEQQRADRDNYVIILWNNIESGQEHNFYKYSQNYSGQDISSFDFNSIMMYSSTDAASSLGLYTITKTDGSTISRNTLLSTGDKKGLYFLYGPIPTGPVLTYDVIVNNDSPYSYQYRARVYHTFSFNQYLTYPRQVVMKHTIRNYTPSTGQTTNIYTEYYTCSQGTNSLTLNSDEILEGDIDGVRWEHSEDYELLH